MVIASGGAVMIPTIIRCIFLLACSGSAVAQELYHFDCKVDLSTGYRFDEALRSWQPTQFKAQETYTLRHLTDTEIANQFPAEKGNSWGAFKPGDRSSQLLCPEPSPSFPDRFVCGRTGHIFELNSRPLRFQLYYSGGYVLGVDNNENTPFIEIGRCKFEKG